jgi:hypothetical protein
MYIPVMALVTYILLSTLLAGLRGAFQPELLGYTATWAFFIVVVEILGLKLGCYLLSISNESQLLDLVAYSGYKFVGVIVTLVTSEIVNRGKGTGGWIGWTIFGYCFLANALFLVCCYHVPIRSIISDFYSSDPLNTSYFQKTRLMSEVRCKQLRVLRKAEEPSFYSYTHTLCNWSSCGLSPRSEGFILDGKGIVLASRASAKVLCGIQYGLE